MTRNWYIFLQIQHFSRVNAINLTQLATSIKRRRDEYANVPIIQLWNNWERQRFNLQTPLHNNKAAFMQQTCIDLHGTRVDTINPKSIAIVIYLIIITPIKPLHCNLRKFSANCTHCTMHIRFTNNPNVLTFEDLTHAFMPCSKNRSHLLTTVVAQRLKSREGTHFDCRLPLYGVVAL